MRLDIKRIEAAVGKIDPVFLNSPQYVCESLSRALGCRIVLKVETMNPIRCFKGRGVDTVCPASCRERTQKSSVRVQGILVKRWPTVVGYEIVRSR